MWSVAIDCGPCAGTGGSVKTEEVIKVNDHFTATRRVTDHSRVVWIDYHPPGSRQISDAIRIVSNFEAQAPEYEAKAWSLALLSSTSTRTTDVTEVRLYIEALDWACTEMVRMNDEIATLTQ